MRKVVLVRRWAAWLALLWLASCAVDSSTDLGRAGGGGHDAQQSRPTADLPGGLRMTALRALQEAPGYDFAPSGDATTGGDVLEARIGACGAEARVALVGERVAIGPTAANVEAVADDDALGLQTVHVGRLRARADAPRVLPALLETRAEGQEAVLAREGVDERYLAGPLGLEQSYRIEAAPAGVGALAIEVAFDGLVPVLRADMAEATDLVELVDAGGATRAVYRDLAAVDAEGRELPARMEVGDAGVTLVVDDEGAAYPLEVDPLLAIQQAKLTASDGAADDYLGVSVSLSGDTAVVGAPYHNVAANADQGAAFVFVRNGSTWSEQAELTASDGGPGHRFGWSVSVSGDTAIAGSLGVDAGRGAARLRAQRLDVDRGSEAHGE